MKSHNAVKYHCLCCGSVVHCELDAEVPQCCGQEMVKVAAEATHGPEGQDPKKIPDEPRIRVPPIIRAHPKDR